MWAVYSYFVALISSGIWCDLFGGAKSLFVFFALIKGAKMDKKCTKNRTHKNQPFFLKIIGQGDKQGVLFIFL